MCSVIFLYKWELKVAQGASEGMTPLTSCSHSLLTIPLSFLSKCKVNFLLRVGCVLCKCKLRGLNRILTQPEGVTTQAALFIQK